MSRFVDLEEHDKQIRADVINTFLKELYPCKYAHNDDCAICLGKYNCLVSKVEQIAKKLKE